MSSKSHRFYFGESKRIVLIGMAGSGKSSVGNAILDNNSFDVQTTPESTTNYCEQKEGRNITIVEMPGMFNPVLTTDRLVEETERCMEFASPGLHVFLLVIKVGRCSEDVNRTIKWIETNFGPQAFEYTIVLFSHCDQLNGKLITDFIAKSSKLRHLINRCGNRYHTFNNKASSSTQVDELMEKIDTLIRINQRRYYTNEMYTENKRNQRDSEITEGLKVAGVAACAVAWLCVVGALANNN